MLNFNLNENTPTASVSSQQTLKSKSQKKSKAYFKYPASPAVPMI